jgi:ATP-dependent DNA helicase RecQ
VRLLQYFGEDSTACGNCDNCLAPPETWDATEAAQKALSAIYRTGQRFGAVHLTEVLRGRDSERVRRFGHDALSVFGVGRETDELVWRGVFRQLVALGLAHVDHEAHGALKLTEASRAVLKGYERVAMRRQVEAPLGRKSRSGSTRASDLDGTGEMLLSHLKAWRLEQARVQSVPAYVILNDNTLAQLARVRPQRRDDLLGISGIGAKKLERYGAALLEILRRAHGNAP